MSYVGGSVLSMVMWAQALTNPVLAVGLRVVLGAYVVFMARKFYADPMGYFRRVSRNSESVLPDYPQIRQMVRWLACFCVWGGCFIIASAIAGQILDLHGWGYAGLMVVLAGMAAYLLLPDLGGRQARARTDAHRTDDGDDVRG